MLFSKPEFDLVLLITPANNPVDRARKVLHKRFPNIKEQDFSDNFIAKAMSVDGWMDLRPCCEDPFSAASRNIANLDSCGEPHPLGQSAINHLAFITQIMDCFIKACESLSEPLNLGEDYSFYGSSNLSMLYYLQWLPMVTGLMSVIAGVKEDNMGKNVKALGYHALYEVIVRFSDEANNLVNDHLDEFYDYYDTHYGGQFDRELDNLKNYMGAEFGYAVQYINMLSFAKKSNLLPFTINPAISDKGELDLRVKSFCNAMHDEFGIVVKSGKAKDVYAELAGFSAGYQQMKNRLYRVGTKFDTETENERQFHKLAISHYGLSEGGPSDGVRAWEMGFADVLPIGCDEVGVCEEEFMQHVHECLSDDASAWEMYYRDGENKTDFGTLMRRVEMITRLIALITTEKNKHSLEKMK